MKQIIFGLVCMLLLTFFVMILMTVHGRSLRQSEAEHSLSEALDTTMSNLMENRVYSIESKESFITDLLQSLLVQFNSTSDITVNILEADEVKGILSVEVTEHYDHPNGNKGSVSTVRTVIFDKEEKERETAYTVEFYTADKELYKRYTLPENSVCILPKSPQKEGKTFLNWRFVTGGNGNAEGVTIKDSKTQGEKKVLALGGIPYTISQNIRLIAVFE